MSSYRQDPFVNLDSIQKNIQQELGRLFEGDWVRPSDRQPHTGAWSPATDTIESETQWHFLMDLPGVDLSDIAVSVHRGQIVVKGQRSVGESLEQATIVNSERAGGEFERLVTLPEESDESSLHAAMKNGVLHLSVDKLPGGGARPIPVSSSS